jgi:23S rRNA pseudouridine2604 synthase
MKRVYAGAEPVRLNKWLAQEGVCSRREAEALIAEGRIRVDGANVGEPGFKIAPGQSVEISGETPALTFVLNKPVGFVSAQPEQGQIPAARLLTKANLIGESAVPSKTASLAPLGRLDQDSRGLLLLSDDGVLAKAVIGPASKLDKEYLVRVSGEISQRKLERLRHGLELDGRKLKPAIIEAVEPRRLRFILQEGRKRQIRRMCAAVDLDVADLLRIRIGPLKLGALAEGKWRALTSKERDALIQAAAS